MSRATLAACRDSVSRACRGFCWGRAVLRCQGSSCSQAAAMLREGEGCCSPRKGGSADVGGVGALSGFRPAQHGVGPHQGFVAGSVGIGRAGTFGGSRAVWCHAGHHPGFGACGGWGLAAWCCSSQGWGPSSLGGGGGSSPALVQVESTRVNQAPGRVLCPQLPVTTGSRGTRRGGPQLAGSSLLLREELLPWRV